MGCSLSALRRSKSSGVKFTHRTHVRGSGFRGRSRPRLSKPALRPYRSRSCSRPRQRARRASKAACRTRRTRRRRRRSSRGGRCARRVVAAPISAATVWALVRVAHRVARARASFGGKCAAATHGTDSRVRAPARCFRLLHTDCRAAGVLPSGGRSRERRRRCPRTRLRGIGGRGRRGRAGRAALAADEEVILREPALENVPSWLEQRRVRRAEVSWRAPVLE